MTTPPLSPAASAVSLAAANAHFIPVDEEFRHNVIAAAALRAAADAVDEAPSFVKDAANWQFRDGMDFVQERLRAIASELEVGR